MKFLSNKLSRFMLREVIFFWPNKSCCFMLE